MDNKWFRKQDSGLLWFVRSLDLTKDSHIISNESVCTCTKKISDFIIKSSLKTYEAHDSQSGVQEPHYMNSLCFFCQLFFICNVFGTLIMTNMTKVVCFVS